MKRRSKRLFAAVLILAVVFLFTGCGGIMAGKLDVNEKFSGSRTIQCSISLPELDKAVEGGSQTLQDIIRDNCPPAMKYRFDFSANDLTCFFTISFTDAESYQNKIRQILPDTEMVLLVGDGDFAAGIRLEEDFTDRDLLAWFDEALLESGAYRGEKEEIWAESSAKLILDGQTVSSAQPYTYDSYKGVSIAETALYTTVMEDGSFVRDCVFRIDGETYEKNKKQFSDYLMDKELSGVRSSLKKTEDGRVEQTLSFHPGDAKELDEAMKQLFGSSVFFSEADTQESPFIRDVTYAEHLSFADFPSENYRYYVRYEKAAEGTAGLSDEHGDGMLSEGWISYPVTGSTLSTAYSRNVHYRADSYEAHFFFGTDSLQEIRVALNYTGPLAEKKAQNAAAWYQKLSGSEIVPGVIRTEDTVLCSLSLSRREETLQYFEPFFGGSLVHEGEQESRFFSDRSELLLDVDFTELTEKSGARQAKLVLSLPQGMEFLSVVRDGREAEAFGESYLVWADHCSVRAAARVLRIDRIILVVLLGVLLLIILLLCIISGIRIHVRQKEKGAGESFRTAFLRSLGGLITGRIPEGADKEGICYFYGRRGPQLLLFTGVLIVPLLWSVFYLIFYRQAESFYFFSGMLRYLSIALFVLCGLTVPAAFIWRYYQKAPDEPDTGRRMIALTEGLAEEGATASAASVISREGFMPALHYEVLLPDIFERRGSFVKRQLNRFLRQFSRSFADIEKPVCVRLSDGSVAASRSLHESILLFGRELVICDLTVNPALGQTERVRTLGIPAEEIKSFTREEEIFHARSRSGLLVRSGKVSCVKAVICLRSGKKVRLHLPGNAQTAAFLKELTAALSGITGTSGTAGTAGEADSSAPEEGKES